MEKGKKSTKKTILKIVLAAIFIFLCVIPWQQYYVHDGGSVIYCPIIPVYSVWKYHKIARPVMVHNDSDTMTDEEYDILPEYIEGYGVYLLWFEVWCDKSYEYTDGHTEKIPWLEARKL